MTAMLNGQRADENIITLRHREPQLRIQLDIVVPGEDMRTGQLFVRQPQHLGERRYQQRGHRLDVDKTHRGDDRHIA